MSKNPYEDHRQLLNVVGFIIGLVAIVLLLFPVENTGEWKRFEDFWSFGFLFIGLWLLFSFLGRVQAIVKAESVATGLFQVGCFVAGAIVIIWYYAGVIAEMSNGRNPNLPANFSFEQSGFLWIQPTTYLLVTVWVVSWFLLDVLEFDLQRFRRGITRGE